MEVENKKEHFVIATLKGIHIMEKKKTVNEMKVNDGVKMTNELNQHQGQTLR
jgi:hypothetical protein